MFLRVEEELRRDGSFPFYLEVPFGLGAEETMLAGLGLDEPVEVELPGGEYCLFEEPHRPHRPYQPKKDLFFGSGISKQAALTVMTSEIHKTGTADPALPLRIGRRDDPAKQENREHGLMRQVTSFPPKKRRRGTFLKTAAPVPGGFCWRCKICSIF